MTSHCAIELQLSCHKLKLDFHDAPSCDSNLCNTYHWIACHLFLRCSFRPLEALHNTAEKQITNGIFGLEYLMAKHFSLATTIINSSNLLIQIHLTRVISWMAVSERAQHFQPPILWGAKSRVTLSTLLYASLSHDC